mgnify:CR=1 FL=1
MSLHMQVFLTNLAWMAVSITLVTLAYLKLDSLHSFWFLGVYWLGHSEVRTRKEPPHER